MLIALNACTTVGPDFTTPPADVTDDWIEEGDQRLMAEPADFRKWWTAFEDPVLDRLIETAYERNLSLRIAGVRVAEARAILGIAVGELYPQVQQGFGSLEYIRGSERAPSAPQPPLDKGADYSFRQAELGAGVGWELDFWGRFRRAIESAEADFFSSIANYDNVLVSLTSDVAATYVLYRTFEERIRIALENMDTQRESLEIATTRFDNGATSERDVQQAQTQLSSTEATIPVLEIGMRKSRNALGVLLGMTPAEVGSLVNEDGQIPLAPLELAVGIPADLLRRRPDIREAEYQAAAQSALIGVAKADLYPAFSLNGSFGFLASDVGTFDLGDIFEWKSRNGFFGPSFQWNLFNYGRITNNVRVQDARLQERILAYQDVVLRAQQEVEDGLADYLKGQERVFLLTKAAEAAKRSAELALIQYREGATDYTTVLTALQSQLDQQESLAISLGEVPQGMIAVYRALGGGWELREGNPFIPTADAKEMEDRTDWGGILLPVGLDSPAPSEGFPGVRRPDW
jgi:NodT family efflux transporter outer membrane factor (OMF) lipoprotein